MRRGWALVVAIVSSCSASSFDDPEADLSESTCRHPILAAQHETLDVRCATLTVPEVRDDPDSPRAELPIAVFTSRRDDLDDAPPVIYLEGGPGGSTWYSSLSSTPGFVQSYKRPVIAFEQRGASLANPALECWSHPKLCLEEYRARGIRTDGYNVVESARDVCTAIDRLGYSQAVLHGVSYGTALAQEVLRLCPERIAAAWLDGVVEVSRPWSLHLGPAFQAALDRVFVVCATRAACSAAYPDLPAVWTRLLDTLSDERSEEQWLSRSDVIGLLFNGLYDPTFAGEVPALLYLMAEGRWDAVSARIGRPPAALGRDPGSSFALGMYMAVSCNDDIQYLDRAELESTHRDLHPVLRDYFLGMLASEQEECASWRKRPREPKSAVRSDIPVLITGGGFDPITPVAGAERVASGFSNATFVQFADSGHGLLFDDCANGMWRALLARPDQTPPTTCARRSRVEFVIER